jgi:hypothetical protein
VHHCTPQRIPSALAVVGCPLPTAAPHHASSHFNPHRSGRTQLAHPLHSPRPPRLLVQVPSLSSQRPAVDHLLRSGSELPPASDPFPFLSPLHSVFP